MIHPDVQWVAEVGFSVAEFAEGSAMVLQESDGSYRLTLVFNNKNMLLTGINNDTSARSLLESFLGLFRAN